HPARRSAINGAASKNERLILLCHKFRCLFRAAQHGQRESVVARAATNLRRIVAIEFGTWRSGRNGGSSGLVTFAYGNLRAQRGGTISCGGNRLSFGDQECVGRNAKCGVMVEAAPSPSFKMSQPDLL